MTSNLTYNLPIDFLNQVNRIGALQLSNGSVEHRSKSEVFKLLTKIIPQAEALTQRFGQRIYGSALVSDLKTWSEDVGKQPDFSASRDALIAPEDGAPFFFLGPLRLANGGRKGWRLETFLSQREDPYSPAYQELYTQFPHPKNICQPSHLLSGSLGIMQGNNMVFFPENIQASRSLESQEYAVFFFNKFYDIYNKITIPKAQFVTDGIMIENPTFGNRRANYLARCVWGYLHDYFHHQGIRPFDENVSIKTRWFTGLIEEIKVDLEVWLACHDSNIVDARVVAEFVLLERAFRYPCELDWNKNFDSGTGLLLLSLLEKSGVLSITNNGSIQINNGQLPDIAHNFIEKARTLEYLPDNEYLIAAKALVRQYLPENPNGTRIGFPPALSQSHMAKLVGSTNKPLKFHKSELYQSMAEVKPTQ